MIKLSHIKKIYETSSGPLQALKDVSLTIDRGEIYGIIGLSGAGKSTLVRCINMLERPTEGTVEIDGQDLTKMNEKQLRAVRKKIGMIFQQFNLLSSSTVYENVAFPLKLAGTDKKTIREKVMPLLKLVGLEQKAQQYPAQLSGGQKQRVGIARALASGPSILLCDEATSALDPQTTQAILNLIKKINRELQITVVIITHEMKVIKDICTKVAVIDHGVIAEKGPVIDVFINPQQAITREFISVLLSDELPSAFRQQPVSKEPIEGGHLLLRLTFIGESADEPVIMQLIKNAPDIDVSILFGDLDQIQAIPYGRMIIGLKGSAEKVEMARKWLEKQELKVEVIGYVRRNDTALV
ncbi:methionine ABC transporter ATP-binding protein [Pectinatus cerevisiiphilus]|uniref:methionine ABC transporter ATP-binding protein n=1 Tax=Pectinatus cerevisiiphilus TaxID=86956 RepID=UPI0018C711C8|nr:methionine ABC transporter ATP-binding protein [Pectinatus cerevisiiphilus]